jgi:hypothetical protein
MKKSAFTEEQIIYALYQEVSRSNLVRLIGSLRRYSSPAGGHSLGGRRRGNQRYPGPPRAHAMHTDATWDQAPRTVRDCMRYQGCSWNTAATCGQTS